MCNSNNNINNINNINKINNDGNSKDNSLSNEIASFVYNLNYNDIDSKTINRAKIAFLDYLAVTLRGSQSNSAKIAIKTFNDIGIIDFTSNLDNTQSNINNHQSSIISGHNIIKSDTISSGFVNGISAHALDLDDGHSLAKLHIGSVVFSSALAVAEAYNVTGKSFLESVIAAYDVAIAIGMAINPQHRNNGFHTTGTVGTIASTVASSKLMSLNKNQIVSAVGLAGTGSSGLLESNHTGVMAKHLNVANAVRNGITSAILAKNGFTGSSSIIEGKQGIISAMAKNNSDINNNNNNNNNTNTSVNGNNSNINSNNVASIISNLGKFHINDIYIKKYPVCRHLHSSIDAVLDILANIRNNSNIENNSNIVNNNPNHNHNFIDSIESVNIKTYKIACEHNNYSPNSLEDLRQSLPYSVAMAIIYSDLTEDIISDYFNINLNNTN
ncbi:MAG: MmgE/PrpD family protein, partial [Methanobacteriaceae archaeon]